MADTKSDDDLGRVVSFVAATFELFTVFVSFVAGLIWKRDEKEGIGARAMNYSAMFTFVGDLCLDLGLWSVFLCVAVLRRLASEGGCGGSTRLRRLVLATASVLARSAIDEAF